MNTPHALFQPRGIPRNVIVHHDPAELEVDALGGRPGMYSARFGGPGLDDAARAALLISELHGVPDPKRTARYRAVVALVWPAGREPMLFEGVQEGTIGHEPRGGRGFGYDPVFLVDGVRAQAEISDDEKDLISHRGKAVRAAAEWLASHCP